MIKLSEETKSIITFAVKYCSLVKIDTLLIDQAGIRAKQDLTAVYLIEPGDYSFLEFGSLYITRISALAPKIKMFEALKKDYDIFIEVKELDNEETVVKSMKLRNSSTSVNFNCSVMPQKSKLPKKVKDPLFYEFKCDKDTLDVLGRGVSAMGASILKLSNDDSTVVCTVKDMESDMLKHTVAESYSILSKDAEEIFDFDYDFKIILPLLKEAAKDDGEFDIQITRRGIMRLFINSLSMYIFPEKKRV